MDLSQYIFHVEDAYCVKESVVHISLAVMFAVLWIRAMLKKK